MSVNISKKEAFVKEIIPFIQTSESSNIEVIDSNTSVDIIETSEGGEGKITLDLSSFTVNEDKFFIKITHQNKHVIGTNIKHCDGILLYVNLEEYKIDVYLFELKTTISLKVIYEKARYQLYNAYLFIKYLDLEECFSVKYRMCIGYGNDSRINNETVDFKNLDNYKQKLIDSWSKNRIAIKSNFCNIKYFDFFKIKFDNTYIISA